MIFLQNYPPILRTGSNFLNGYFYGQFLTLLEGEDKQTKCKGDHLLP